MNMIMLYVFEILFIGYNFIGLGGGGWRSGGENGVDCVRRKMLLMNFFPCICLAKGNILSLLGLGLLFGWFICGLICSTARDGMQVTDWVAVQGPLQCAHTSPPALPFLTNNKGLCRDRKVRRSVCTLWGWGRDGYIGSDSTQVASMSVSGVASGLNLVHCI